MSEIKDSGKRESFATGAVRDTREGKGRFDLIPYEGIEAVARIFEEGAKKYEARNWEKGIPISRVIDSGLRHAHKAASGHEDEDHLAMAAWNFIVACAEREWVKQGRLPKEIDDRPDPRPEQPTAANTLSGVRQAADSTATLDQRDRNLEPVKVRADEVPFGRWVRRDGGAVWQQGDRAPKSHTWTTYWDKKDRSLCVPHDELVTLLPEDFTP